MCYFTTACTNVLLIFIFVNELILKIWFAVINHSKQTASIFSYLIFSSKFFTFSSTEIYAFPRFLLERLKSKTLKVQGTASYNITLLVPEDQPSL